jgi:hypothetical protein
MLQDQVHEVPDSIGKDLFSIGQPISMYTEVYIVSSALKGSAQYRGDSSEKGSS